MKHQIDPTVDCVFKAILGAKENTNILIDFLNAFVELEGGHRIKDVIILNPYNERDFETDKLSVVDIKARDERGYQYQIEIQILVRPGLANRMLYTWSRIYNSMIEKGDKFTSLKPVISIWLIKENLFNQIDDYHMRFGVYDPEHQVRLTDHLLIQVLQLRKFQFKENEEDKKASWMYFFKEGKNMDSNNIPEVLNRPEIKQAFGVLERFSKNQRDYLLYQSRLDVQREMETWKDLIEQERKAKEEERRAKEKEREEKERLLAILKKAGIDPNQEE